MRWLVLALLVSGCTSNRVILDPDFQATRKANYEDHFDYYVFGFIGHNTVDLQRVCMERKAQAAEQSRTFEDGFFAAITLGMYAPLSVRVWCE